MAAEASTGRFRPAAAGTPPASASARVALAAAGLTVVMFGACGVLLLLTRDYQRAAFGAGGTVAALVCLVVGFVVARRQPASPIGWLLLGWSLLTPLVGVALLYAVLDYRIHHGALPFGPVAVMLESGEFGIAVLAALTVLLFPDGRPSHSATPGGRPPRPPREGIPRGDAPQTPPRGHGAGCCGSSWPPRPCSPPPWWPGRRWPSSGIRWASGRPAPRWPCRPRAGSSARWAGSPTR